jgi:hypothetical protein
LSWSGAKVIIAANELDKLTRRPSQLRAYRTWSIRIREEYGSMPNFILKYRLGWEPLPYANSANADSAPPTFAVRNPVPLADRADYKILRTDWPYGVEAGIVHICVWLKTQLPVVPETGGLTDEGQEMVQSFVTEHFERGLGLEGQDRVLWFKNWGALQSVRALEHFHVFLRLEANNDALLAFLERHSRTV